MAAYLIATETVKVECAPVAGQDQAAVLTVDGAC